MDAFIHSIFSEHGWELNPLWSLAAAAVSAMLWPSSCRITDWQTDWLYRQEDRQADRQAGGGEQTDTLDRNGKGARGLGVWRLRGFSRLHVLLLDQPDRKSMTLHSHGDAQEPREEKKRQERYRQGENAVVCRLWCECRKNHDACEDEDETTQAAIHPGSHVYVTECVRAIVAFPLYGHEPGPIFWRPLLRFQFDPHKTHRDGRSPQSTTHTGLLAIGNSDLQFTSCAHHRKKKKIRQTRLMKPADWRLLRVWWSLFVLEPR